MLKRSRLTNMLIAGTLTVLVLTIFLAFRGENVAAADANANGQEALGQAIGVNSVEAGDLQSQIESLQAQNGELRSMVALMQQRDAEFQRQIAIANQTIRQLSSQNNNQMTDGGGFGFFGFDNHAESHESGERGD